MSDSDGLYTTILRAQLDDAHRAIAAIWQAHKVALLNGGGAFQRHVVPAIYEAAKCLPDHLRKPDMPIDDEGKYAELKPAASKTRRRERNAPTPAPGDFDDLL